MNSAKDRATRTMDRLLELIKHPNTEDERDTARRMLQRIREAQQAKRDTVAEDLSTAEPGTSRHPYLYNPGAWEGSNYAEARRLPVTEIAKLIRVDIRMAQRVGRETAGDETTVAIPDPIGDAPRPIKYSVRTRHHRAIDVEIRNIPQEWGWTVEHDPHGYVVLVATDALAALVDAVEAIYCAYNYDNSDVMADYFDRRYWGSVKTDPNVYIRPLWLRR